LGLEKKTKLSANAAGADAENPIGRAEANQPSEQWHDANPAQRGFWPNKDQCEQDQPNNNSQEPVKASFVTHVKSLLMIK
jgi:hypothetical protein